MNFFQNPVVRFINTEIPLGESIFITPRSIIIVLIVFFITWLILKAIRKIVHRALADEAKIKFKLKDLINSGIIGPIILVMNDITKKITITIRTDR